MKKDRILFFFNDNTTAFISEHRNDDAKKLALQGGKFPKVDMPATLDQIQGWQTALRKLPSWAATEGIVYPPHLNMEQCSSEPTAIYKASICANSMESSARQLLIDLTGGFGVDFSFMSRDFKRATYVERDSRLCAIASHNFDALGLKNASVANVDAEEFLNTRNDGGGIDGTLIYIDPARRGSHGQKVYKITDCEPDVIGLLPQLSAVAGQALIKLSPMLDWHEAVGEINRQQQRLRVVGVHIVSVGNECKELLIMLKGNAMADDGIPVHCVNDGTDFVFIYPNKQQSVAKNAIGKGIGNGGFLYEPNASIMKAGCFGEVAVRFHVSPISDNTHLFTSDTDIPAFPGRRFQIIGISSMNKKDLRQAMAGISRANVAVRNFPMSAEALKKRLKVSDGGDIYIFGTTLADGSHVIIKTKKSA